MRLAHAYWLEVNISGSDLNDVDIYINESEDTGDLRFIPRMKYQRY